jgi:hypothetical protein
MKLTQTYIGMFTTNNPTTGEPSDADSLPEAFVYKNGEPSYDISLTVSQPSNDPSGGAGDAGVYKIVADDTWGNSSFVVDDKVDIYIYTIISGAESHAIIDSFILNNGSILASDGLDDISIVEPTGRASNFREMLIQLYMRFFNKVDKTTSKIRVYKDGEVLSGGTSQTYITSGGVDTVDEAETTS